MNLSTVNGFDEKVSLTASNAEASLSVNNAIHTRTHAFLFN